MGDGCDSAAPKVVELFCGIGGFRLAADELGLDTVWANDHHGLAQRVYERRLGELVKADIRDVWQQVPSHDLLTAGFPCQPFSSAGKKLGVCDPRGTLFQVIVDVLRARRPRRFVLENVKRLLSMDKGRHFATVLEALCRAGYRVEWRLLNAQDFGLAQNRERIVLLGFRVDGADAGSPVTSALLLDHEWRRALDQVGDAIPGSGSWTPVREHRRKFSSWGLAQGGSFLGADFSRLALGRSPVSLCDVLQDPGSVDPRFDFTESTRRRLAGSERVDRVVNGVQIIANQRGGARMGYTVFGPAGVAPTLTSTASRHYERYRIGDRYRRLTNVEYARLQGFPDDHCDAVSVYHQYALYGNAVPPPLAAWAMARAIAGSMPFPRRAVVGQQRHSRE